VTEWTGGKPETIIGEKGRVQGHNYPELNISNSFTITHTI
jgi:hypothetical protein